MIHALLPPAVEAGQEIPIPAHLEQSILKAVNRKLKTRNRISAIEKVEGLIEVWIARTRFRLFPPEASYILRGEPASGELIRIDHPGGDLLVETSMPGLLVELYSERRKYLDNAESGPDGRAVFADIGAGVYYVRIKGYQLAEE